MLKFENDRNIASISASGTTAEITADVLLCIYAVWNNIKQKDLFRDALKEAIKSDVPFVGRRGITVKDKPQKNDTPYVVLDEIKSMLSEAGFNTDETK